MIQINDLKDDPVSLYDPNDNYLGEIENYLQWLDVRLQISQKRLNGYYVKDKTGKVIEIDNVGGYSNYELMNESGRLLSKLISVRFDKKLKSHP